MSASLALIATSLETAAGASTSTNPNESGYWKRIADAAETLAGAATTANEHAIGYMKRAAVALESIAGTSGAEENPNEAGYMKRIVDALEVQAGAVEGGSLMHRLTLGAQNATFGGGLGSELVTNGTFATNSDWTLGPLATISGGQLHIDDSMDGDSGSVSQNIATVAAGSYEIVYTITSISGGSIRIELGDTGALTTVRAAPGTYTQTISAGAGGYVKIKFAAFTVASIDNVSVREVL